MSRATVYLFFAVGWMHSRTFWLHGNILELFRRGARFRAVEEYYLLYSQIHKRGILLIEALQKSKSRSSHCRCGNARRLPVLMKRTGSNQSPSIVCNTAIITPIFPLVVMFYTQRIVVLAY